MGTRTLTKEQLSNNTTIDGNRLEKALEDTKERFNELYAKDIDFWVENRFNASFTPRIRTGASDTFNQHYEGPFVWNYRSSVPDDLDDIPPNNAFRYKGSARIDPLTGQTLSRDFTDTGWFWTSTKYFSTPTIINDVTMFGMFDDKMDASGILDTESWFTNTWKGSFNSYQDDFHLWICVDNPLNTGDTFQRNSEVHLWTISARSLLLNSLEYIQTYSESNENAKYNPALTSPADQRANALACRLTELNIPVFANSRVRFVFAIPGISDSAYIDWQEGTAPVNSGYANPNEAYTSPRPSFANNIWSFNMSVLQPLARNK